MPVPRDEDGYPQIQHTLSEVFIIESLNETDERASRYEGRILYDVLKMAEKKPKYFYFQSKEELKYLVCLFRESRYRYLHISSHACHGSGYSATLDEIGSR